MILWQVVCVLGFIPSYLLPDPVSIFLKIGEKAQVLFPACLITVEEAVLGLGVGVVFGFFLAVIIDSSTFLRRALLPLLSVSQTIPIIAVAPLLVLLLGFGILPKVVLVALMTFFPISIACVGGFSSAPVQTLQMSRSCGANFVKTFLCVKVPFCAKTFFDALKISVTYAFSGAVIAEWLGGDVGLGVMMTRARKSFDMTTLFACVFLIVIITILAVCAVKFIEKKSIKWRDYE